jgi:hypothetical protein
MLQRVGGVNLKVSMKLPMSRKPTKRRTVARRMA